MHSQLPRVTDGDLPPWPHLAFPCSLGATLNSCQLLKRHALSGFGSLYMPLLLPSQSFLSQFSLVTLP